MIAIRLAGSKPPLLPRPISTPAPIVIKIHFDSAFQPNAVRLSFPLSHGITRPKIIMSPRRAYIQRDAGSWRLSALPMPNTMLQINETINKTAKVETAKKTSHFIVIFCVANVFLCLILVNFLDLYLFLTVRSINTILFSVRNKYLL